MKRHVIAPLSTLSTGTPVRYIQSPVSHIFGQLFWNKVKETAVVAAIFVTVAALLYV